MNPLPKDLLTKVNEAAIYNMYLYLVHFSTPFENASLQSAVEDLEWKMKHSSASVWSHTDWERLHILIRAVTENAFLAGSRISNLTVSESGLTACVWTNPKGEAFVVFRGTGKGEWIDNGEGLSGIPEENTYKSYGAGGTELFRQSIMLDDATDQQVEALNWFNRLAAKEGWTKESAITLSGHSKGGNKAQFIAIHSDLVDSCYSFDGHGFSPEALASFQRRYGKKLESRRQNIYSFSTQNDYINVLGVRLVPEHQIYYFKSRGGIHELEAMLRLDGGFNDQCEQGKISRYVESVSEELMNLEPRIRKYATLGVMNVIQSILGEGAPVNGDDVSAEQTLVGMAIATDLFLRKLKETGKN